MITAQTPPPQQRIYQRSIKKYMNRAAFPVTELMCTLKKNKAKNEITNPNWHFLTGTKQDIYSLACKSYFVEDDIDFSKDSTEFMHTQQFILVDKTKRIKGICNGTLSIEMQQMLDDIKTSINENN